MRIVFILIAFCVHATRAVPVVLPNATRGDATVIQFRPALDIIPFTPRCRRIAYDRVLATLEGVAPNIRFTPCTISTTYTYTAVHVTMDTPIVCGWSKEISDAFSQRFGTSNVGFMCRPPQEGDYTDPFIPTECGLYALGVNAYRDWEIIANLTSSTTHAEFSIRNGTVTVLLDWSDLGPLDTMELCFNTQEYTDEGYSGITALASQLIETFNATYEKGWQDSSLNNHSGYLDDFTVPSVNHTISNRWMSGALNSNYTWTEGGCDMLINYYYGNGSTLGSFNIDALAVDPTNDPHKDIWIHDARTDYGPAVTFAYGNIPGETCLHIGQMETFNTVIYAMYVKHIWSGDIQFLTMGNWSCYQEVTLVTATSAVSISALDAITNTSVSSHVIAQEDGTLGIAFFGANIALHVEALYAVAGVIEVTEGIAFVNGLQGMSCDDAQSNAPDTVYYMPAWNKWTQCEQGLITLQPPGPSSHQPPGPGSPSKTLNVSQPPTQSPRRRHPHPPQLIVHQLWRVRNTGGDNAPMVTVAYVATAFVVLAVCSIAWRGRAVVQPTHQINTMRRSHLTI